MPRTTDAPEEHIRLANELNEGSDEPRFHPDVLAEPRCVRSTRLRALQDSRRIERRQLRVTR